MWTWQTFRMILRTSAAESVREPMCRSTALSSFMIVDLKSSPSNRLPSISRAVDSLMPAASSSITARSTGTAFASERSI